MTKDLYNILGVSKTATEAELKSAYRKLARKYHPDVNKDNKDASDKFKEVSCAYDILSDKGKRAQYDRGEIDCEGKPTGYANFGGGAQGGFNAQGNPFSGFGANNGASFDFSSIFGEDIFSQFAGGGAQGGFHRASRRPQKGNDISYHMSVDFLSAANGTEKTISIMGKNVNVKIPAGMEDGQTLRLKNMGQAGINNGPNGDVLITVSVAKHPYFTAEGKNILIEVPISVKEAVLGAKITIPTLTGRVSITIPPYSSSGEKLRLKGKGIKSKAGFGDEIVTLKVVMPKQKEEKLEKALLEMADEQVRNF